MRRSEWAHPRESNSRSGSRLRLALRAPDEQPHDVRQLSQRQNLSQRAQRRQPWEEAHRGAEEITRGGDQEQDAEDLRNESGAQGEQSERHQPETPEHLNHDGDSLAVQSEEEIRQRISSGLVNMDRKLGPLTRMSAASSFTTSRNTMGTETSTSITSWTAWS